MFIDSFGLIVQNDGDGGDTLQREGMYAFGVWARARSNISPLAIPEMSDRGAAKTVIEKFEVRPGIYVRHPDSSRWSSKPETTSRDQLIPVIAYCAAYRDYGRLWRLFKAVARRGFFAQNLVKNGPDKFRRKIPDTMIAHLGLFIRAGGRSTWPLYPLLLMMDLVHLLGTLLSLIPIHIPDGSVRFRWKEGRDVDDNNLILAHLMAAYFVSTPLSWIDRKLYARTRRSNQGTTVRGETNAVMGALVWYHRAEAGGNPEMAALYRPLIEKYFAS